MTLDSSFQLKTDIPIKVALFIWFGLHLHRISTYKVKRWFTVTINIHGLYCLMFHMSLFTGWFYFTAECNKSRWLPDCMCECNSQLQVRPAGLFLIANVPLLLDNCKKNCNSSLIKVLQLLQTLIILLAVIKPF